MKKMIHILTPIFIVFLFITACSSNSDDTSDDKSNPQKGQQEHTNQDDHTDDNEDTDKEKDDDIPNDESADDNVQHELNQKEHISKMAQQEVTNFTFKLPEGIPISKGKYLSAETDSKEDYFEMTFYESDEKTKNDSAVKIARVQIEKYGSQGQADNQISFEDFSKAGGNEINLGHDITGYQDAGAGSVFTSWNEGRWALSVRATTDESDEGVALAKKVVEFLETNTLPAPKQHGNITLEVKNEGTTIQWEDGTTVYTIDQVTSAMDALKIATQFK